MRVLPKLLFFNLWFRGENRKKIPILWNYNKNPDEIITQRLGWILKMCTSFVNLAADVLDVNVHENQGHPRDELCG